MDAPRWEYCGVEINAAGEYREPSTGQWMRLSELGDDRWEMVQIVQWQQLSATGFAFFKRPRTKPQYITFNGDRGITHMASRQDH
jgi:hypothetical protein